MRASVSPRQSLVEAGFALVPAFGADLDLAAALRGLLALDVPLAFGFGFGLLGIGFVK
jgi:hypothetical protein